MLNLLAALALLAQPMVQVPVDDPTLPYGVLAVMGPLAEGDLYVDPRSFERSDLPGMVLATGVIVRPATDSDPAPLLVARIWVDCARRLYQIADGRLYDAGGQEMARTSFVRDKAFSDGSGPDRIAEVFCDKAKPDLTAVETVLDFNEAIDRTLSMDPGD